MKTPKLLTWVLALLLILAACGGTSKEGSSTGTSSNSGTEGKEGTETSNEDPIDLGFILSLTGNFAFMGGGVKEGIELYFEQHDYKIGDRPVKLHFHDDAGDPQKALQSYQQLSLNEDIAFLGGGTIGGISLALSDAVDQDRRFPLLNVVGSGNNLSWDDRSDYVWRVGFSSHNYAGTLGIDVAENIGKRAVILASDYVAGHEQATDFSANFAAHGGEVVEVLWAPNGTSDFSSYINQINQMDIDAVFFFIPGADGPRFIQQFREFGLDKKFALVDGGAVLNAPSTIEAVGNAVVGGITLSHYHIGLENELNKQFVEAYTAKHKNKTPDSYVVNGYDTAKVMAETILQAGSTDVEAILEVLNNGFTFDSPRGPMEMDPRTNHPIMNLYILEGVEEDGEIKFDLIRTYEKVEMPAEDPGYPKMK